ncbi:MAG: 6,7-dimethyl-8-ribityllumazine synthase [Acidobacteriia bacterium]|nr:6,7-dimethyl-8-ribityllumazine synthase [Terriglobia bacterium]MYG01490.1 6,7-dimethyl-8-ribityllumazine synthase [Terriglobia bacterium]MYK08935.1 6,7-dimethyl-8-ribityllumazine synthase [Terriglobia bacterium]
MPRQGFTELEGGLDAAELRLGCVVSRFNSFVTDRLLEGALDAIRRHGGDADKVFVARVPGSLELATAARALAQSGNFDALICLGAVIRGDTAHYEHVASGAASQIARVGPETGVPTIFGVLTCDTVEQAIDRSGAKSGNAGSQAAASAIEMANLLSSIRSM